MGIFRRILSSRIFWYCLLAMVMLIVAFYLVLGQEIESTITRQLLDRKRIIARAEVGNITTFFEKFGNSVATLAQLSSIETNDADATSDIDTFVKQRREANLVSGVVLTDKNGVVQFNSNVLGIRDVGASLSDRDYFVWAKTKGERGKYFISQPVKGIIVVASPVIRNNKFSGVVASSVQLKPLADRFLGIMKVSVLTETYLVDGNGELLYGNPASDAVGSNISEFFSDDLALSERIKNALGKAKEDQFQTKKHLIAYSPVILGNQSWLLIVSSPTSQVVDLTRPLYVRQASLLAVTAVTILVLGLLLITRQKNHS